MRIFNTRGANYWFDTFNHLESFNVLTTSEILDLFGDTLVQVDKLDDKILKSTKFTDNCGFDGTKRNFWDVEFFGKDDLKFPEVDLFYKLGGGQIGETELSLESKEGLILQKGFNQGLNNDILGYQASRYDESDKFIYLEIPYEFFDDFMTTNQLVEEPYVDFITEEKNINNFNMIKIKEFVNEVESTEKGWKPSNFIPILNRYDKKYPDLLKYIGSAQNPPSHHKWRQNFSIFTYITMRDFGLAFPIWTQINNNIFYDGIHRVVGTFLTKSDVPVFIKIDDDEFSVITAPLFNGYKCKMNIEVYNKKVSFLIDENVVGVMK